MAAATVILRSKTQPIILILQIMKKLVPFFSIMFTMCICTINAQYECDTEDPEEPTENTTACNNYSTHPQNGPVGTNSVPMKEVSVMFHIVQDENGLNNFGNNSQDLSQLQAYIDELNTIMGNLIPSVSSGTCSYVYTQESKIRYINKGVKFYTNGELICTDTRCMTATDEVFDFCITNNPDLTNEEKNNYFPILVVGWRGQRFGPNNNTPDCDREGCDDEISDVLAGLGPAKYVIVRGLYSAYNSIEDIGELFSHELGHSFGLPHSWLEGCCDLGLEDYSNNVMD
jgi:hypothetical protein